MVLFFTSNYHFLPALRGRVKNEKLDTLGSKEKSTETKVGNMIVDMIWWCFDVNGWYNCYS